MEVSGQLHAPASLPSGKELGTYSVQGQVDSRAGLDTVAKTRNPYPVPARNRTSIIQPISLVTILAELPRLQQY
jgi:hypothetical protein